ncbi:hypothetical protein HMPREF0645_1475 [Hallella bergensis DSM 17361]|uniref:Uncharacterized protein n=1 Tax=Hallella bergensis DSM 17361 TaxID=585502 RepID=D1PWZ0_9BACT|nr:hypothetical protein HMPREF0645_1475 [Hallella bergensis DSM 17361]
MRYSDGGFHKQVQSYTIFVYIISFGFINPFIFHVYTETFPYFCRPKRTNSL